MVSSKWWIITKFMRKSQSKPECTCPTTTTSTVDEKTDDPSNDSNKWWKKLIRKHRSKPDCTCAITTTSTADAKKDDSSNDTSESLKKCIEKPESASTSIVDSTTRSILDNKKDGPAKRNIFQLFRRNWPQFVKILPGILFMWTAGMKFVWQNDIPYIKPQSTQYMIIIAWVISLSVGATLAVVFINTKLKMNTVHIITTVLHLTPILAVLPHLKSATEWNSVVFYVDVILPGFIFGLNFVTVLCYVVDNSTRDFRGTLIPLICKISWIFTAIMKLLLPKDDKEAAIFKQITYIFIAILAFITIYIISRDTFDQLFQRLIKEEKDKEAMEFLESQKSKILRSTVCVCIKCTSRQKKLVESAVESQPSEHQEATEEATGCNICTKDTLRPLILVLGCRIVALLVNTIPLFFIVMRLTDNSISVILHSDYKTSCVCYVALSAKVVAGVLVTFIPDCIECCFQNGHVKFKIIRSQRIYYIAALLFAILLLTSYYILSVALKVIVVIIYAVIGVGIDAISFKHLSEAFPLARRSGLIAIVLIIETFFDSGLMATITNYSFLKLTMPIAVGIAILSVCLLICLPTKRDKQKMARK